MNKCAVFKYRGHLGLNQGPLDQQLNSLPLSYIPWNMVTIKQHNYITLITYEQMRIVSTQGKNGFEPGTCRSAVE